MSQEKLITVIKHFKTAFEEVTHELLDTTYESCEKVKLDSNLKLSILIGITGNNKGRISLNCTLDSAKNIATAMNFGDPLDDPKDLYLYMAEFANIFSGRTATYVNNEYNDREMWLAPPAIFSGENLEIITPKVGSEFLYYKGTLGSFIIEVGFERGN